MPGIVYHLFCLATGKAYIGQTWQTLDKRWQDHRYRGDSPKLRHAIQKHGPESFIRSVLTQGLTTQEDMNAAESYWIKHFDSIKNGYNVKEGGNNGRHSEETKELLRKHHNPRSNAGHPISEGAREKISRGNSGKVRSEEHRVKDARAKGGRPFVDQNGARYETIQGAARTLGLQPSCICQVLKGLRRSTGSYVFKYAE